MKVSSPGANGIPIGKLNPKYTYIGTRPIIPLINYDNEIAVVPSVWINMGENNINVQSVAAGNTYVTTFTMILEKPL